ncbi:hypothetical protein BOTBODRAFT_271475 [Botryobasidium botryosum FD-172 SS1]|uniref:Uncharacterized protein n=1 Tax=Botryobasidium botryosum (strain FD-172 SS1) TaxID=930990 RepID=A0A067LV05_BOTB1|nr:hypothetical protein BOTBODRAFT_271475 [Botryobasidium botryosum FD-172 SS1]
MPLPGFPLHLAPRRCTPPLRSLPSRTVHRDSKADAAPRAGPQGVPPRRRQQGACPPQPFSPSPTSISRNCRTTAGHVRRGCIAGDTPPRSPRGRSGEALGPWSAWGASLGGPSAYPGGLLFQPT